MSNHKVPKPKKVPGGWQALARNRELYLKYDKPKWEQLLESLNLNEKQAMDSLLKPSPAGQTLREWIIKNKNYFFVPSDALVILDLIPEGF